jgi:predicted dehydrogenase
MYEFHTLACAILINPHWGEHEGAEVCRYEGTKLVRREILPKGDDRLHTDGFDGQMDMFLRAVRGEGAPSPTVEQCLTTIEICEAVREGRTWRAAATDNIGT